jgi:hypothetical protein
VNHLVIAFSVTLLFIGSSFVSDNCDSAELLTEGVTWTMTDVIVKDSLRASRVFTVIKAYRVTNEVNATVQVQARDGKGGKSGKPATLTMDCFRGTFKTTFAQYIAEFPLLEGTVRSGILEYPDSLDAGDGLAGCSATFSSPLSVTEYVVKSRKCDTIESKTTPAGTWICYRIRTRVETTSTYSSRTSESQYETVEWFNKNVGVVRIDYYIGGRMIHYSELTSLQLKK